jgi:hypothetical protein
MFLGTQVRHDETGGGLEERFSIRTNSTRLIVVGGMLARRAGRITRTHAVYGKSAISTPRLLCTQQNSNGSAMLQEKKLRSSGAATIKSFSCWLVWERR